MTPINVPRELFHDLHDLAADATETHRAAMGSYRKDRQAVLDKIVSRASALLATAQPAADGEREQFEAVVRDHEDRADLSRNPDGSYSNYYLECVWQGFQMRAALPAKAEGVAVPEGWKPSASLLRQVEALGCDIANYAGTRNRIGAREKIDQLLRLLAAAPVPPVQPIARGDQDE